MLITIRSNKHTMLYLAFVTLLVLLAGVGSSTHGASAATDVGYRDHSFAANLVANPTGEKPQSKLWFNDGIWWASMFNQSSEEFHIYRYDRAAHTWSDTGTLIDERNSSKADTLWDGAHLYVASAGSQPTNSNHGARILRYSYDPATKEYTRDAGFPVSITPGGLETIVLDKDSTGRLWVTYAQNSTYSNDGGLPRQVYVNHALNDDQTWGTPFVLPVNGASNLTSDDISAVVSFDSQIGVMWSNQINDAVYFATHKDGDPDNVWQSSRTAIQGPKYADDHLSLRSVQATDSSGRVFAAVKTSLGDLPNPNPNAPLIMLLERDVDGNWTNHTFSRVGDNQTRPILMLDEEHRDLYMFATSSCCSGGAILYKKTNISNISFPDGPGEPFIRSDTDVNINDATSTKQNVSSATGLMVMASSGVSGYYWHNAIDLAASDTTPPVAPVINSPADGSYDSDGNVTLSGTTEANSTVEIFDGAASEGATQADALGNWSKTLSGVAEGSHTYTAKATDAAGNTSVASGSRTVIVDTTVPSVNSTTPAEGATNVAVGASIEATFSEAMNSSTVGQDTFILVRQGTTMPVTATVSYDAQSRKAVLKPTAALAEGATYTATIKSGTNGVKDAAGNLLQADKTLTFSTTAVTAPSNLSAARAGTGAKQRVNLNWADNSKVEAKFVIERSTASNFTSNLVTYEAPANATSYSDTGVQPNKQYFYQVFAVNSAGTRSVASNVASVTTGK